ncbi:MAG: hypothetical protein FD166_2975 [Bacteroidetes bacterium]|nr:MAG: hypothetical protein FD166_2975 [Bacteroidota bacterium]
MLLDKALHLWPGDMDIVAIAEAAVILQVLEKHGELNTGWDLINGVLLLELVKELSYGFLGCFHLFVFRDLVARAGFEPATSGL